MVNWNAQPFQGFMHKLFFAKEIVLWEMFCCDLLSISYSVDPGQTGKHYLRYLVYKINCDEQKHEWIDKAKPIYPPHLPPLTFFFKAGGIIKVVFFCCFFTTVICIPRPSPIFITATNKTITTTFLPQSQWENNTVYSTVLNTHIHNKI